MRNIMNFDAQAATAFVIEQSAHIEQEVNQTIYPEIQYAALIPVDTSAHPLTQTVSYYSSEAFGRADWVNGNADDIPMVGGERAIHKSSVYTAGVGYGFSWEEVAIAMRDGINLQAEDAQTARRAYEEMVDDVAFIGSPAKGMSGFLNYPGVSLFALPRGDWDTATEEQILADVNTMLFSQARGTLYTSLADTLLLPHEKLNLLATRRLGDTGMTILEFLRKNNTYTAMTGQQLTIRAVRGLETAGAGGSSRVIAYRRNPQVLKMHIPMPHRFFPVWQAGPLRWEVPGLFRMGGLDIRRKEEVRYGDGI